MAAQSTLRHPQPTDRFSRLFDRLYEKLITSVDSWQHRSPRSKRTTRLIAALALTLTIITTSYGGYRYRRRKRKEREEGRTLVRMNSSKKLDDGTRVIYVPYKDGQTRRVTIHPTKATTFDAHRRLFLNPPVQTGMVRDPSLGVPSSSIKPGMNLAFLHQYMSLMSIMVPRWRSKESALLVMLSVSLIARTWLSIFTAKLEGRINGDLVAAKGRPFLKSLCLFLGVGILGASENHYIKYLQAKVSIAFRTRLTRYIHDLYVNPSMAYYKLHNLDGGVAHADQYITQDVTLFCDQAASLFSSIGKPLVDLFVLNFQLYHSLGRFGVAALLTNYFTTATLLQNMAPPFGRLKALEGLKEGQFRALHSRLIANAEEVAFYAGGPTEKVQLERGFKELRTVMQGLYKVRVAYNMLEDFVIKYCWSASGYLITSIPVFLPMITQLAHDRTTARDTGKARLPPTTDDSSSSNRMTQFVTNKNIMLNLGDAGSRLMYSMKDLSELAGYTSRVFTLVSTLHRVNANAYYKPRNRYPELYSLADVDGTLAKSFDGVRLENVPVVAPALFPMGGEELIESLTFQVKAGDHVLITGPNGAGKSAVARIVAGLWPTFRGITARPRVTGEDGIMFIPQRPYLTVGTLRDQVIYPHTEMDMQQADRRDAQLQIILEQTRLGYLPEREGGWDTKKTWKDVLSGGEKQRMQIARLLYHEPRYAFIDEGTSAVSSDVEGLLYETCKGVGITLITISTRASLKRYHDFTLTLGLGDDASGYEFQRIGTQSERESVEAEVRELRDRLAHVEEWKRRRDEIDEELKQVWTVEKEEEAPEEPESNATEGQI
ncbi:putative ABC transporter [Neohortaea acidophila]|uniref:Putative ABC transporter n=1 Tax=Neohortaea acidophila TaxID=245834 RepID=A0A6A6PUP3_9PEZI|nr:putative ABC transporter [Neohortaea acidophila]KAF2483421.1 putative ABC transporter [Neohortaea acidophila]